MRYGAEGYGLYWYCIEHICDNLEPRLTFELEHDCEILAHELRIDTLRVEEIMRYMVQLGLFERAGDVITCMKLAAHLGDNLTRNNTLKTLIKSAKSQTVSDNPRLSQQEERRGDKKNTKDMGQNRTRFVPPTVEDVTAYVATRCNPIDPARFIDFYESKGWMVGKNKMRDWQAAVRNWEKRDDGQARKTSSTRRTTLADDLTDTSWAN